MICFDCSLLELAEERLATLEAEPSVEAQRAVLRKEKLKFAKKQAVPLKIYQVG